MCSFLLRDLHIVTVLLLTHNSYKNGFISLKLCVEFSIFDFVSFLLYLTYLFNKKHRQRCGICSKLIEHIGVFIVNFEHISHLRASVFIVNFE